MKNLEYEAIINFCDVIKLRISKPNNLLTNKINKMKNCPNCRAEILDNFEVCWNCNFSLTENKIIEIKDSQEKTEREIDCLRC